MSDCMTFPDTVEEFMEQYKIVDTEHVYTNGVEMVPIFRMKQWFEHKPERKKGHWIIRRSPDIYHCGHRICSECGFDGVVEYDDYNFCPNCGADLRGNQDENN